MPFLSTRDLRVWMSIWIVVTLRAKNTRPSRERARATVVGLRGIGELASRLDHFVPSSQLPMGNSPESTLSLTYRGDSVAFGFRGSVTLNCAFYPTFDLPHGVPRSQPILGAQSIALPSN